MMPKELTKKERVYEQTLWSATANGESSQKLTSADEFVELFYRYIDNRYFSNLSQYVGLAVVSQSPLSQVNLNSGNRIELAYVSGKGKNARFIFKFFARKSGAESKQYVALLTAEEIVSMLRSIENYSFFKEWRYKLSMGHAYYPQEEVSFA